VLDIGIYINLIIRRQIRMDILRNLGLSMKNIISWTRVHHKNRKRSDNKPKNLILTSIWEHCHKFHRENFDQACERCGRTNVTRHGHGKMGKQMFMCNNCELTWIINKMEDRGAMIDYCFLARRIPDNCSIVTFV